MKRRFVVFVMALAILALPALAKAEVLSGFYAGVHGGFNFKMDSDNWLDVVPDPVSYYRYNTGGAVGLALGYGFATSSVVKPRAEVELTWRRNNMNSMIISFGVIDFDLVPGFKVTDSSLSIMANFLLDFDLGSKFNPYLGIGIGAARVWIKANEAWFLPYLLESFQDTAFAYQGKIGFNYLLTSNISLFAEYNYLRSTKFEDSGMPGVTTIIGGLSDHSVMVGLRFAFN